MNSHSGDARLYTFLKSIQINIHMDTVLTLQNKQKLIGMLKQHFQIEKLEDFIKTISANEDEKVDLMLIAFSMHGCPKAEITESAPDVSVVEITFLNNKISLVKAIKEVTGKPIGECKDIADLIVTPTASGPAAFKIGRTKDCILNHVEWDCICDYMNKKACTFQWRKICNV